MIWETNAIRGDRGRGTSDSVCDSTLAQNCQQVWGHVVVYVVERYVLIAQNSFQIASKEDMSAIRRAARMFDIVGDREL